MSYGHKSEWTSLKRVPYYSSDLIMGLAMGIGKGMEIWMEVESEMGKEKGTWMEVEMEKME